MITKEQWLKFLGIQYKALNIDADDGMSAFIMLATVESFLRQNGEI